MKIRGLHIDGYGVHHDLGIDDLPDGLTIVCGPNEAGKTTLQHFLVGMLFGFTPATGPTTTHRCGAAPTAGAS